MSTNPGCKYLSWDSEFFGRRIAQVTVKQATPQEIRAILEWCREEAIDCLYYLVPPRGFQPPNPPFELVDVRIELDRDIPQVAPDQSPNGILIRTWKDSDLPALGEIAQYSFTDSRFYADGHFPEALCNELYRTWMEKSCHGYANEVLVAELAGKPSAFITCHIDGTVGQIGLLGVATDARSQGVAQQVVMAALEYFRLNGCRKVTVVTQGRNIGAQRLYQRCTFRTSSLNLWYHGWLTKGKSQT